MTSHHVKTTEAAKGKWRGILLELGVPREVLTGKHGPCPLCGGRDRFRFDNKEGRGTWICNQCGAGDGIKLAVDYVGKPFPEVAGEIDRIVGNIKPEAEPRKISDDERRKALRAVYSATDAVRPGDLVDTYLRSRGLGEPSYPKALRFAKSLRDGEGGTRPAMVALVGVHGEKAATLHRTFLRPDGRAKAEMRSPRKLMPGEVPPGSCVQLSEWTGGVLGIAEGIETAMAASAMYDIPVWAALNANLMTQWSPPQGCEEVAIFGDTDASFTGQAAAYALAQRLASKGMPVTVHLPPQPGEDWADINMRRAS